ncbi:MAG: type II toxin-antitoxin system prevent-host-death family antitoxin [Chitinivibrionales bacterium]|nr:type II toxin-antitoxin system prevent-host-death family antitoxin [Chitinivibrionales bacterium]
MWSRKAGVVMIAVAKGELKAHLLEYFRRAEKTGEEIIVTDRRRPVLKIVPFREKKPLDEVFGSYRGKMEYSAPLDSPTEEAWGELRW